MEQLAVTGDQHRTLSFARAVTWLSCSGGTSWTAPFRAFLVKSILQFYELLSVAPDAFDVMRVPTPWSCFLAAQCCFRLASARISETLAAQLPRKDLLKHLFLSCCGKVGWLRSLRWLGPEFPSQRPCLWMNGFLKTFKEQRLISLPGLQTGGLEQQKFMFSQSWGLEGQGGGVGGSF